MGHPSNIHERTVKLTDLRANGTVKLTHFVPLASLKNIDKQCRPRSDATKRGV